MMGNMLNSGMFASSSDEWETPFDLFALLDDEFHFTLDPCSTDENRKCEKHYTKVQDGLKQDWTGEIVWCNPPYGKNIWKWCRKCYEFSIGGGTSVMLLPARTDTEWFHKFIYGKAEIRFIRGRLHFGGSKWNAPFPSMIAIFKGNDEKLVIDSQNGRKTHKDKQIKGQISMDDILNGRG